jgi:hypothetical protein
MAATAQPRFDGAQSPERRSVCRKPAAYHRFRVPRRHWQPALDRPARPRREGGDMSTDIELQEAQALMDWLASVKRQTLPTPPIVERLEATADIVDTNERARQRADIFEEMLDMAMRVAQVRTF